MVKEAVNLMDEENVGLHEFVEVKLINKNCSYNRHVKLEVRIGDNLCIKTGEFNKYYRLIDREKDRYQEVIRNADEKLIHSCIEPLSRHINHGSANKKK